MAYRDELEALRAREAQLEGELGEVRRLRIAGEKRALPLLGALERIRVASPCPAKWEDMIGDDRVRFCGSCAKNVYDLSAMTRDEAEAFLAEKQGPGVCITMRKRADGRVLTVDCPVGVRRRRFGLGVIAFAAAAAGAACAVAWEPDASSTVQRGRSKTAAPRRALAGPAPNHALPQVEHEAQIVGLLAPRAPPHRTTGCMCQPGDPLCSCL